MFCLLSAVSLLFVLIEDDSLVGAFCLEREVRLNRVWVLRVDAWTTIFSVHLRRNVMSRDMLGRSPKANIYERE